MNHLIVKALKPRNQFALAGRLRRAGAHQRCGGGLRQQARCEVRRELRDMDRQRHSP